ncbi:MAG: type II toxin-antitoxin system ParD family antitoxin [Magnetococcales bacterium]|nr:type II toxin-antitoxin system ParD family antitoxin [Magnetococcales bacterium]
MGTNVSLTTELETFARTCVADGRYNNVSEVVRMGLRLLQEREDRRHRFNAMLDTVRDEAKREGVHTAKSVLDEMKTIIDKAAK